MTRLFEYRVPALLAGLICICTAIAAPARATSDLERAYRIIAANGRGRRG